MSAATFTTTCARCAAPLDATDAAVKAHEERCFAIGDRVRWDGLMDAGGQTDRWAEGEIVAMPTGGKGHIGVRVSASSDPHFAPVVHMTPCNDSGIPAIRRIPRPEQAVVPMPHRRDPYPPDLTERFAQLVKKHVADAPLPAHWAKVDSYPASGVKLYTELVEAAKRGSITFDAHPIEVGVSLVFLDPAPPNPLDVKHDGVTLRELIRQDTENTQHDRLTMTGVSAWRLTPAQRAAVSDHWSAALRDRVAASKERERLSVIAPDLDLETANCKDAE